MDWIGLRLGTHSLWLLFVATNARGRVAEKGRRNEERASSVVIKINLETKRKKAPQQFFKPLHVTSRHLTLDSTSLHFTDRCQFHFHYQSVPQHHVVQSRIQSCADLSTATCAPTSPPLVQMHLHLQLHLHLQIQFPMLMLMLMLNSMSTQTRVSIRLFVRCHHYRNWKWYWHCHYRYCWRWLCCCCRDGAGRCLFAGWAWTTPILC